MKINFAILLILSLLSGCATQKHIAPAKFIAPVFNVESIPNPPTYPNNLLSNNVIKVPSEVPVTGQAVWYKDNLVAFMGTKPKRSYLYTYIFNTHTKEFHEVTDKDDKNEINLYLTNKNIEWVEDTSAARTALNISMNVLEVLTASIFTIGDPRHYSRSKSYYGYCSNIEGTKKIKVTKTESNTGLLRLSGTDYYVNENEISSAGLSTSNTYLTTDGTYLISGTQIIDATSGQLVNSIPTVTTHGNSLTPRLHDYFLSPDLSKLFLIYQDNKDNSPISYSIEIVDFILPKQRKEKMQTSALSQ
jgi:hypothetical protein